jgi:hypothetical protein
MEFQEIQQYLEANKESEEVKKFIGGFITTDRVKSFLSETEEGKKLMQSEKDSHFTKSLETWKNNNLNVLIDTEIAKRYPEETEDQKRIRKLETELVDSKKTAHKTGLKNRAITTLTEKGIPIDFAEHFLGDDEAMTDANIAKLESIWQDSLQAAVELKFKENGRDPYKNNNQYSGTNPWKTDTYNLTMQAKIIKENPELAKALQSQAK